MCVCIVLSEENKQLVSEALQKHFNTIEPRWSKVVQGGPGWFWVVQQQKETTQHYWFDVPARGPQGTIHTMSANPE
jgi:16S rRNA C967 or C1407 C5-methylase (RsmB/RsmF family)